MRIKDAPPWVERFLQKKAPWWLEGTEDYLDVLSVDEDRMTARVRKDGFVFTLDPRYDYIR